METNTQQYMSSSLQIIQLITLSCDTFTRYKLYIAFHSIILPCLLLKKVWFHDRQSILKTPSQLYNNHITIFTDNIKDSIPLPVVLMVVLLLLLLHPPAPLLLNWMHRRVEPSPPPFPVYDSSQPVSISSRPIIGSRRWLKICGDE